MKIPKRVNVSAQWGLDEAIVICEERHLEDLADVYEFAPRLIKVCREVEAELKKDAEKYPHTALSVDFLGRTILSVTVKSLKSTKDILVLFRKQEWKIDHAPTMPTDEWGGPIEYALHHLDYKNVYKSECHIRLHLTPLQGEKGGECRLVECGSKTIIQKQYEVVCGDKTIDLPEEEEANGAEVSEEAIADVNS